MKLDIFPNKFGHFSKIIFNVQGIKEILIEASHNRKVAQLARETGIDPERIYKWIKRGVIDIKTSDAEKILKWANMDKSPELEKPKEDRYVALLEDNDRFFKSLVSSSLAKMAGVQDLVVAHLKAIVSESVEEKSGGDHRKKERLLAAWNKRIASNIGLADQKDIHDGGGK